ncbi:QueT transporter family protein [Fusibacter paucivorans]|uniref:QueT transporter family protein n=1 Tax=Fusibacter paucivorans TaxID=76009 RepID=A0ABS5PUB1_9FIRM|nr:QueT transporter family protein [Fusibacter paucivorans]MBS7527989.1 QueT transporter family protein [Fusibacter paucivorans]
MKRNTHFLVKTALVAALYVVITFAFYFLSYEAVQFRVSEVMVLLAFIDPLYIPGLVLGCFMANLMGPYGIIDAVFGSFSSLVALLMIYKTRQVLGYNLKGLIVASLWPAIFSFIIAFEITVVFGAPESFWFWTVMVAVGEFVVITLAGVPIFSWIIKQDRLTHMLGFKAEHYN